MVYEIIPFGRTTDQKLFDKLVKSLDTAHEKAKKSNGLIDFKSFETVVICGKNKIVPDNFTTLLAEDELAGAGTLRNIGLTYINRNLKENDFFTYVDADDIINEDYYVIKEKADIIFTKRAAFFKERVMEIDKRIPCIRDYEDALFYERTCKLGEQVWGKIYSAKYIIERFRDGGIWEDSIYSRKIMNLKPSLSISENSVYFWRRDNHNSITKKYLDEENFLNSKRNLFDLAKDNFKHGIFSMRFILPGLRLLAKLSKIPLQDLTKELTSELGIAGR